MAVGISLRFYGACLFSAVGNSLADSLLRRESDDRLNPRRRRRRFRINTEIRCVGAHPFFGPWSRRGLNPIKPVYDQDRPDGRLLTASAFN